MTKSHINIVSIALLTGVAIAFVSIPLATAHHGFQGRYDLSKPIWLEGTVVRSYFGNPHSVLTVEIADTLTEPEPHPDLGPAASFLDQNALSASVDLHGKTVQVELPPTSQYSRLGGRIATGDRIAAVVIRNCEPPHQLNAQWLRLADGSVESRQAAMIYMVEAC
ncbi:DUF6152 family protein [Phyllobacterium sp. K27]